MFDFFYGDERVQFKFVSIPDVFFDEAEEYSVFFNMSIEAKVLYGFLLRRMTYSQSNGWIDEKNRVYIIYKVETVKKKFKIGNSKACGILQELEDIGLISRNRRGQGKASVIYVHNFIDTELRKPDVPVEHHRTEADNDDFEEMTENCAEKEVSTEVNARQCPDTSRIPQTEILDFPKQEFKNSQNGNSKIPETRPLEFPKRETNYNKKNYKNLSYTHFNQSVTPAREVESGMIDMDRAKTEEKVREMIDYDSLYPDDDTVRSMVTEIKDIIVDVLCGERNVIVYGKRISEESAKAAYSKLTSEHVIDVLGNILNYPNPIKKIDRFIAASLYNAAFTENLSTFTGFTANTGIRLIE